MESATRPRRARRGEREPDDRRPPSDEPRVDQLSLVAAAPAADDHLDRSCRSSCSCCSSRALPGFKLERAARATSPRRTRLLLLAGLRHLLSRVPAARLRWAVLLRGTGFRTRVRDCDRDHLHLVARQLPRSGQARRRLPGLPAQDQQRRSRCSRTFGTVFIERILDLFAIVVLGWPPASSASASGLPAEVQLVFAIGVVVVVRPRGGLLTMRNFGRRIITACRCLTGSSSSTTGSRRACSRRVGLRALPRPGRPDRAHLGDRGDCACTWSSWPSASRTSSSASAARSSWP